MKRLLALSLVVGNIFGLFALVSISLAPASAQVPAAPAPVKKVARFTVTEGANQVVLRDDGGIATFGPIKVHVTDGAGKPLPRMAVYFSCGGSAQNKKYEFVPCRINNYDLIQNGTKGPLRTDAKGDASIEGFRYGGYENPRLAGVESIMWDTSLFISVSVDQGILDPRSGEDIAYHRAWILPPAQNVPVYSIYAKRDLVKSRSTGKCLTIAADGPSMQTCSMPGRKAIATQSIDIVRVANTDYVKLQLTNGSLTLYSNSDGRFGTFAGQEFADQYWEITPSGNGYRFRSVASNKCLYANDDGRFGVGPCGFDDQLWNIVWAEQPYL